MAEESATPDPSPRRLRLVRLWRRDIPSPPGPLPPTPLFERIIVTLIIVVFLCTVGGALGYGIGVAVSYGLPNEYRPRFSGGRGCVYVCLLTRLAFAFGGALAALTVYAVVRRRLGRAERDGQLRQDYEERTQVDSERAGK